MTCKDCIHYEVCENGQWYETPCVHYKNKADFVEVVRCKDCNHWIYWADEKRCSCDLHHAHTHRDDFCSHGVRK